MFTRPDLLGDRLMITARRSLHRNGMLSDGLHGHTLGHTFRNLQRFFDHRFRILRGLHGLRGLFRSHLWRNHNPLVIDGVGAHKLEQTDAGTYATSTSAHNDPHAKSDPTHYQSNHATGDIDSVGSPSLSVSLYILPYVNSHALSLSLYYHVF